MNVVLEIFESVSLVLGLTLVYLTFQAGKISSQKYLYQLSLGFTMITLGSIVEELLIDYVYTASLRVVHLIESTFVNSGLMIIIYALKSDNAKNVMPDQTISMGETI